jgi:copper resistance protein C
MKINRCLLYRMRGQARTLVPMRTFRYLLGWLFCLSLITCLTTPVDAHSTLAETKPTNGEVLTAAPEYMTFTFTQPLDIERFSATVTTGTTTLPLKATSKSGNILTAPLELTASGNYTVRWNVDSPDGHGVEGTVAFQLSLPLPPTTLITSPTTVVTVATPTTSTIAPHAIKKDVSSSSERWKKIFILVIGMVAGALTTIITLWPKVKIRGQKMGYIISLSLIAAAAIALLFI